MSLKLAEVSYIIISYLTNLMGISMMNLATLKLTAYSWITLENLIFSQLVKFPAFCGTWKSHSVQNGINAYLESDKSNPHPPIIYFEIHFSISLSFLPSSSKHSLSFSSSDKKSVCIFYLPLHATSFMHFILLHLIAILFDEQYKSWSSSLCSVLHFPVTFSLYYLSQHPVLEFLSL